MTSATLTTTHRRARWWQERVVPALATLVLVTNAAYALVLIFAPESEFTSAVYSAAFDLMEQDGWGMLLLALTAITALTAWVQGRSRIVGFWLTYALGTGYWMFWTILSVWSALGLDGASGAHAVLAASMAAAHVLAGLAWPMVGHDHRVLRP